MSVPSNEAVVDTQGSQVVELPAHGDAAFSALMDALAPEAAGAENPAGGGQGAAAAAAPGGTAPPREATGAGGAPAAGHDPSLPTAGAPAAGAGGSAAPAGTGSGVGADGTGGAGGADAAGGGSAAPATWTAAAADLIPQFGEMSKALEGKMLEFHQGEALEAVKTEHAQYFAALEKHPRLLVGTEVPAIGREGMETLRDSADATEWQEAVKSILVDEVRSRASKAIDAQADFLTTVHASIDLFQNNTDLIPGTKEFDVELANRFAEMATPYEIRVDEKLQGYSIPVQPLVASLRGQLVAERAARAAAPPTGTVAATTGQPAGAVTPPAEPPQAGIPSKAGNGSEAEDFSALFGTLGLPNFRI